VRDWRRHGGLDLMIALGAEGELPPEGLGLVRSLFEMRASIGADAVRLAALRADGAARAEIEARAAALAAADDPAVRTAIYDVLWDRIIDAADNLAYRLALNTLVAGQHVLSFDATTVGTELADGPAICALARAIAAGDPDGAFAVASELLRRSIPEATS
jgi:DNA-binding FadR family transcriptional regulator